MQKIKSIGAAVLGILIFVGLIVGFILVLAFGAKVALKVNPILAWLTVVLFVINLVSLPLVFFKKTRAWYGLILFLSSLIYGLSMWVLGFLVTYLFWGLGAVVIGLFILGVGVVPFGIIASATHHEWGYFWNLIFMVILTFGTRAIGSTLAEKAETSDSSIIDIEPEEKPTKHHLVSKLALLLVGVIPILYIVGVVIDRRSNENFQHPSLTAEHFLLYPADALLVLLVCISVYLLFARRSNKKKELLSSRSEHTELQSAEKIEIKSTLAKVKDTGQNTEIIGWLALAVGAGVIWLQTYNGSQAIGVWIVYLLLGLYLIYSGKYIRYARGKHIAGFLLFNGFLLILLAPGILTLIVSIQSFVNYGRYRKLKKKFKPKFTKSNSLHITKVQAVVFTILIVGGVVSLVFKVRPSSASSSPQSNSPSISSQSSTYTASKNFFTINFPGSPSATDSSTQVSGDTIPITTYDSEVDNSNQEFDVYVYSYPTQDFTISNLSNSDMQSVVKDTAEGMVQAIKGTLVSSNSSSFQSHIATNAQFTTKISGNTYTGYVVVFFVGNNEYGILALGSSQSDFSNFANSFNYTGP